MRPDRDELVPATQFRHESELVIVAKRAGFAWFALAPWRDRKVLSWLRLIEMEDGTGIDANEYLMDILRRVTAAPRKKETTGGRVRRGGRRYSPRRSGRSKAQASASFRRLDVGAASLAMKYSISCQSCPTRRGA